jgi:hypothetical protein
MGKNRNAINFFQPDPMTKMLMEVYQYFFAQAGEQLGIPAYEQGLGGVASGAGKTAHGLSMLMNAASRIMKDAILSIDTGLIKPVVYNTWIHTVMYDEDIEYRGDINIVARASDYLIVAEQLNARRNEFLAATNNDADMAIIGLDGRAKVLREQAKGLKLGDDIIPSDADLEAKLQQTMIAEQQAAEAEQANAMEVVNAKGQKPPTPGGETENPVLPPLEQSEPVSGI